MAGSLFLDSQGTNEIGGLGFYYRPLLTSLPKSQCRCSMEVTSCLPAARSKRWSVRNRTSTKSSPTTRWHFSRDFSGTATSAITEDLSISRPATWPRCLWVGTLEQGGGEPAKSRSAFTAPSSREAHAYTSELSEVHIVEAYFEKAAVLRELEFVRSAIETRVTIPVLSHVLLEAVGNELRISATDTELGARSKLTAKVKEEWALVIPGLRFLQIVA